MSPTKQKPSKGNETTGRLFGQSAGELSAFLQNILESSTEYSIIGKDLDGQILLWNEGARRLYGYEPAEVVGKGNSSMLHTPEDVKAGKHNQIMEAASGLKAERGRGLRSILRFKTLDFGIRYLRMSPQSAIRSPQSN